MKPESDTPRTDLHIKTRAVNIRWPETHVWADADFARTLERELNAAHDRIAELEAALEGERNRTAEELNCQQRMHAMEVNLLQQRIERLKAPVDQTESAMKHAIFRVTRKPPATPPQWTPNSEEGQP